MSNVFLPSANFTLTSPILGDRESRRLLLEDFLPCVGRRPDSNNTARGLYLTDANVNASGGHSHDDVGSYINIDGAINLTGDPGTPGDMIPTPSLLVDDTPWPSFTLRESHNQTNAAQAQAQHIPGSPVPSFTYSEDGNRSETLMINMTAAYATASSLKSSFRTFVYSRGSKVQYISINDTASFSQPLQSFSVALVTLVNWTQYSDGSGGCFKGPDYNATFCVSITSSSPFSLNPRLLRVEANPSKTFTRIAISLICSPNCWIRTLFFKA